MIDEVPWGAVHSLELHGQGPQAAIASQPEGGVFLEYFAVQVHTNVSSHVLGADLQDLARQGRDSVRAIPQPPSLGTLEDSKHTGSADLSNRPPKSGAGLRDIVERKH